MVRRAAHGVIPAALGEGYSSRQLAAAARAPGKPTHLGRPGGRQRLTALQRSLPRQLHPRSSGGDAAEHRSRRGRGVALRVERPRTEEGSRSADRPGRPVEARPALEAPPDTAAAAPRWRLGRRRCGRGREPEIARSLAHAADGMPARVRRSACQRHGPGEERGEAAASRTSMLLPLPLVLM